MSRRMMELMLCAELLVALSMVGCRKAPYATEKPAPQSSDAEAPAPSATGTVASDPAAGDSALVALGRQIFDTGVGASGQPIPFRGGTMMFQQASGGCAYCHGSDGRGRDVMMVGRSSPINYASLREPHDDKGPMYDSNSQLRQPIARGLNEDGKALSPAMPRWQLTDQQFQALVAYLKVLDTVSPTPQSQQPTGGGGMMGRGMMGGR